MKRLISLMLAVLLISACTVTAFADSPLKFNEDGKFSIMHITDTHLEADNIDASVWLIGVACDKEQPDLAVITGDNVQNDDNAELTKGYITKLMSVFEERSIPVAVTFGNHDSETGAMSREELMSFYNKFSVSRSVDDGEALTGCGTYNLPVLTSDGSGTGFNVWVFDSNDYDEDGNYSFVHEDQIEWYKNTSDALREANGGETVYSLAFQHIIVPEVYDALKKVDNSGLFVFEHVHKDSYYMFDPANENYGTLNETPCPGKQNAGQFDAMVEKGDVLAVFSGHDHTNAFGVKHKGIDIVNSLSTRYNGDAFSSQYGYRMLIVDESNPSDYETRVVHWYDMITFKNLSEFGTNKTAWSVAFNGFFQKLFQRFYRGFAAKLTGRTVSYPD